MHPIIIWFRHNIIYLHMETHWREVMRHHLELLATLNVKKIEVTKAGEQKASSWLIRWFNQQLALAPKCQPDC